MATQQTGIVKWFNTEKGYGFIKDDETGGDVFIHAREVEKSGFQSLLQNQAVSFELFVNPKTGKSSAQNLKLIRN
jgi:CspA family cold shock protein